MIKYLKQIINWMVINFRIVKGLLGQCGNHHPHVLSISDTLKKIQNDKCSICRFGDGEFTIILGHGNGFQEYNQALAKELKAILTNNSPRLLVCIPDVFTSCAALRNAPRKWWLAYLGGGGTRRKIYSLVDMEKVYGDAILTRFQTGYKDDALVARIVAGLKDIWSQRDVLIIEGSKTRFGVGNDLLKNAKSVTRVLVPAENAYAQKSKVLEYVKNNVSRDKLIILCCGMTATVMVPALSEAGFQALDLGHLDIQYEYWLKGITTKVAIAGKYVNEVSGGNVVEEISDEQYLSEIIANFA